ncbi:MAG: protein translocase subunit SecD [Aquificaceae bacterium]
MRRFWLELGGFFSLVALCAVFVFFRPVNLGLDLMGGTSILIRPDMEYAIKNEYSRITRALGERLPQKGFKVLEIKPEGGVIFVEFLEQINPETFRSFLREEFNSLEIESLSEKEVRLKLKEQELDSFKRGVLNQTIEVLRRRVDELGVVQPTIARVGEDRVLVELPGILDIQRAKALLGRTATLELSIVISSGTKESLEKLQGPNARLVSAADNRWYLVESPPVVSGSDLKTAYTSSDEFGMPAVAFELNPDAASRFAKVTSENIGRELAIVLDDRIISAPVIRSRISDRGQISGNFTPDEAKELAIVLRSGSLPTKIEFLQERVVGPSLGKDAIEQGIKSAIAGFVFLLLVLILRYRVVGITAGLSIVLNALMLWAGLALLGGTLTLPGIAGIILNMGIAVDSNVLIFERVKEELRSGSPIKKAIALGYRRSFGAVLDTHATLLVAALILFQFGSGPVKGFATTLTIGTIASFVSNVYYARVLLESLARFRLFRF